MRARAGHDLHILVEKPLVTGSPTGVEMVELAGQEKGIVWVGRSTATCRPVAERIASRTRARGPAAPGGDPRAPRTPSTPSGRWNRFNATRGTLVEKCCHIQPDGLILKEKPGQGVGSGGQRHHLDETYDGKVPDILDRLCDRRVPERRAPAGPVNVCRNSIDNEQVLIVGARAARILLPSGVLRYGRREDWGRREVWGQPSGTAKGVAVRQIRDTNIKYLGQHFGASYIEHQKLAHAVRNGLAPEIPLEEGLRAVATGLAAHQSIDQGRVGPEEVLPAGW